FTPVRLAALLLIAGPLAACGAPKSPAPAPLAEAPEVPESTESSESIATPADAPDAQEAGDKDHDHDHAAEEAGGTPHVHGLADLALTRDGASYHAQLVSPLANFGLSEADGVFTDGVLAALAGLIELTGGECRASPPEAEIDTSSGHTDGHVHLAWTCANPDAVSALRFPGFKAFPGFERVNAVYITDTAQKAGELTPSASELSLK
ncbi:MAG: ZrgA family zinc uptake protein, partial [Hyphomonas sp.]